MKSGKNELEKAESMGRGCDILFLPCAGPQGEGEGSDFLMTFLKRNLHPDVHVMKPDMPDPENPHYKPWKRTFERELRDYGNEQLFVVGHSLGASVVLKYLSERPPVKSIAGLFLVSPVFWGLDGWEVDEYAFVPNFQEYLRYIPAIYLYHSKDDAVVPVSHVRQFAIAFPCAIVREFDHDGHLYMNGIPQLVTDIKAAGK